MDYKAFANDCRETGARLKGYCLCLGCGTCFLAVNYTPWLCNECAPLLSPPTPKCNSGNFVDKRHKDWEKSNSFNKPKTDPFWWRGVNGGMCRMYSCSGNLELVEETQLSHSLYLLGYVCSACLDFTAKKVVIVR